MAWIKIKNIVKPTQNESWLPSERGLYMYCITESWWKHDINKNKTTTESNIRHIISWKENNKGPQWNESWATFPLLLLLSFTMILSNSPLCVVFFYLEPKWGRGIYRCWNESTRGQENRESLPTQTKHEEDQEEIVTTLIGTSQIGEEP